SRRRRSKVFAKPKSSELSLRVRQMRVAGNSPSCGRASRGSDPCVSLAVNPFFGSLPRIGGIVLVCAVGLLFASMHRLASFAALTGVAAAGLAAAYVVAGPAAGSASVKNGITICHATSSATNPFVEQTPSADGVLSGHADHPDDIIPPFEVVEN